MAVPALTIQLLGGFGVLTDGRAEVRLPSVRQQELLAFLILHARDTPIPRQRIAGSFWPESSDAQALTNLRRELHHLRDGWPALDALIEAGSRTLAWRGGRRAEVDLIAFETAGDKGVKGDDVALRAAAKLYKGDLLPDCTGEWIEADRERCRQTARSVLTRLVDVLERDRAYSDAIEIAQQQLRLDPLDEPAWCVLMRCHARRGGRAAALHLYQQCAALLKKELGVQPSAATRMTYREILDLDAAVSVAPAPPRTSVYPLVGRQTEWQAILGAWQETEAGQPRLLVIRGEAGIGKTRLAEELVDWCRPQAVTALTARSYGGEGSLAYAPIASWLKNDALRPALGKLDASRLTDVARLHPGALSARPDLPAPDGQLESWQRLRFFESLAQAFRLAAPIVLVLDDLQWADADTIDWLQYFMRAAAGSRCLVVATIRAEEERDNLPLGRVMRQLERDGSVTAVALGPLDEAATAQLAGAVAEHALDDQAVARTYRDTEGHPLFIVERGRMEMAQASSASVDNSLSRVQSVVAARLALLSTEARSTAEVAAALGRDFRFDLLAQVSDLEEDALVRALDELWQRHIVRVQADERWDFSHDRIREVAYSSIGPARARLIHRRIAQAMELLFATRLDEVSASIAGHLDRGGHPARAVPFLVRAAAVAARVSANEEAIRCLTQALALLETLPPGRDRDEQELGLRSNLSVVLNATRGYAAPEIEDNLNRVLLLSGSSDGGGVPVGWLWAAFALRFMLGDLKNGRSVAEQALQRSVTDPSCRCEAHHAMGGLLTSVGELDDARYHFEASLNAYDERHPQPSALGSDLGVFAHAWYSHALWLLGEEDAALTHVGQGVALALRLAQPYSQAVALAYAGMLHQMRRDSEQVLECATAVITLCERYGFAYYADWCHILIGWVRGREHPAEGVEIIESALRRLDDIRAQARRPYYMSLLAETYGRAGNRVRASAIVDDAIAIALERSDVNWLPALYLQQSEFQPPARRGDVRRRALDLAVAQNNLGLKRRIMEASNTQLT